MLNPGDKVTIQSGPADSTVFAILTGVVDRVEGERVYVLLDGWRMPIYFSEGQVRKA